MTYLRKTILILWFIVKYECDAIHFREFVVPKEARVGENVTLECDVDPRAGPLYSLSWWKDGSQFYRVAVTKSLTQGHSTLGSTSHLRFASLFSLPGMKVKAGRRLGQVILHDVEAIASGTYTCEAVADFPTFSQNIVLANLTVIEPPATRPILSGFRGEYQAGDVLETNCTVLRSYPAPTISWFINDHKVKGEVLEVTRNDDHLWTVVSRLSLHVKKEHFREAILNLTCGALVGETLWTSTSMVAQYSSHQKPKPVSKDLWPLDINDITETVIEKAADEGSTPYQRLHSGGTSEYLSSTWYCVWISLIAEMARFDLRM